MDRDTLLPCPFCGGILKLAPDKMRRHDDYRHYQHPTVGCFADGFKVSHERIEEWNRRALAQQAGQSAVPDTSYQRFMALGGDEEVDPIERLRFFCSLAMDAQDWVDVEQFFDAITQDAAPPTDTAAGGGGQSLAGTDSQESPAVERCQSAVPVAAPLTLPEETSAVKELRYGEELSVAGYAQIAHHIDALRAVAQEAVERARLMQQSRDEWKHRYMLMDNARIEAEAQVAALTAELEAARRDAERLEVIDRGEVIISHHPDGWYAIDRMQHRPWQCYATLRDAIDAAMKESK